MLKTEKGMPKIGMHHQYFHDLQNPQVRILLCGYTENFVPALWYHPNRITPFWRFYWGASDGAVLNFADCRLHLNSENVVFVPPDIPFGTEAAKPFSQLWVHFDWPSGPLFSKPLIFPASEERALLESSRILHKKNIDLVAMYMYRILFCYLAGILELPPEQQKKIDPRIRHAIRLLEDREKNWHSADIAKELSISYYHFMDLFKQQVGIPPGQYRMVRRMNYAEHLLTKKELSIKEIAHMAGFASQFHFSRAFKQTFKQSPSVRREKIFEQYASSEAAAEKSGIRLPEEI